MSCNLRWESGKDCNSAASKLPFNIQPTHSLRQVTGLGGEALETIDFFTSVGHRVPDALVREVRDLAHEFLALPLEEKLRTPRPRIAATRGYNPPANQKLTGTLLACMTYASTPRPTGQRASQKPSRPASYATQTRSTRRPEACPKPGTPRRASHAEQPATRTHRPPASATDAAKRPATDRQPAGPSRPSRPSQSACYPPTGRRGDGAVAQIVRSGHGTVSFPDSKGD